MAGRPTKYNPEVFLEKAEQLAKEGKTNIEIAEGLNIHVATLYDWQDKYEEFSEALKKGKKLIDDKIVNSLFTRAHGYETIEIHEEEFFVDAKDSEGKKILVPAKKIKKITKHVVDTTAQIFWLKNRQPEEWRDKKEINVESNTFAEWVKSLDTKE